jgi:hypothetical protein
MDLSRIDGIVQVDVTYAFLFKLLPEMSEEYCITNRALEGDDDDVSTLSFSELCIQDVSIKCLLESEPEGVQPSINLTAATMEMPSTMEILCSNDVWVCNTTASNHFSNGMAS